MQMFLPPVPFISLQSPLMASRRLSLISSFLLLLRATLAAALSSSTVDFLPGFKGPLPFHLETGYVGVGESEDVQLFYYFVKSEKSPENDPLFIWLTGGPGCSAWSGLTFEIGPLKYVVNRFNGSLPTLERNPYSWTREASIIFLDSPVGTGFSYARKPAAFQPGDFNQVHQINEFIKKWLSVHPEFTSNPFYVAGDSHCGIIVPAIVQELLNGNERGAEPLVNFQGYSLGNPRTIPKFESNFVIPFCHGMGIISDELYESVKRTCKREFGDLHPITAECSRDLDEADKCISVINDGHVLEPNCPLDSAKPPEMPSRRSLYGIDNHISHRPPTIPIICRGYGYELCSYWANDPDVRKALHVREGSIGEWYRCNREMVYDYDISSSFQYHVNLSARGVRSLIYSGDHDKLVPFLSTQAWIRLLNYSIDEDWRPWLVGGQVAGFTRSYANKMTFATVKGGGHTAPEYKPEECLAMLQRWLSRHPL